MRSPHFLRAVRVRAQQVVRMPGVRIVPWLVVAAAGALLVAGALSSAGLTCGVCHARAAAAVSGPHKTTSCAACHAGDVTQRLALGLHGAAAVAVSAPGAPPGSVADGVCLACHADVLTKTAARNGLRIRHSTCVPKGSACSSCHRKAMHQGTSGPPGVATMDSCLSCHASLRRNEGCDLCHATNSGSPGATPWSITHGPNWKLTHGSGDLTTCVYCHTPGNAGTKCTNCHLAMPHPEDWPRTHGAQVTSSRAECVACHTNAFCDGCHGMPMPHPTGFLKGHSSKAQNIDDPLCARCHLKVDCSACHVAHIHPGKITR